MDFAEFRLQIASIRFLTKMDSITQDLEHEYLSLFHEQKTLQKEKGPAKLLSKIQKKLTKRGKKYAEALINIMLHEPAITRKYAAGEKYALEYITVTGQIVIYSHPQNPAVKPKIEVHSAKYGFIGWWNEEEFDMEYEGGRLWDKLCSQYSFDPSDPTEVIREAAYIGKIISK